MKIKSFGSICSGVGMQEMAYKEVFNDNIKYFAEIDKFAIKSYNAIHVDIKNLGDFTKAEDVDHVDFMFASTPCQDFSAAGKRKGFEGMRGTLTFEWVKMLRTLKADNKMPKVIGFENVPGIISKKFIDGFELFKSELESLGYKLHQGKLNAKNYGVPQNRNRIFLIGFLEETNFKFPEEIILETRIKDILESEVDEKYYLNQDKVDLFLKQGNVNPSGRGMNGTVNTKDISDTLTTNKGEGPKILEKKIKQIGNIVNTGNFNNPQRGRIYSGEGISPALNCCGGGGLEPKILEEPIIVASRGRNPKNSSDRTPGSPTKQKLEPNLKGVSNTLTTVQKDNMVLENYRIRKLTPKECWRLMGVKDGCFEKAQEVNSNSQLYKQAGNGIVVNVLVEIFKEIKKAEIVESKEFKPSYDMINGEKQYKMFE